MRTFYHGKSLFNQHLGNIDSPVSNQLYAKIQAIEASQPCQVISFQWNMFCDYSSTGPFPRWNTCSSRWGLLVVPIPAFAPCIPEALPSWMTSLWLTPIELMVVMFLWGGKGWANRLFLLKWSLDVFRHGKIPWLRSQISCTLPKTNLDTKNTHRNARNSILQTFLVRVHISVPGCSSYLGFVFDWMWEIQFLAWWNITFPLFWNYLSAAQWVIILIRLVLQSNLGASELIPVIRVS